MSKVYGGSKWIGVDARTLQGLTVEEIRSGVTKDNVGLSNVDNVKQVPVERKVTSGKGMVGGGALSSDITIRLGLPTTLDKDSENEVTNESHTHKIIFPIESVNSKTGGNISLNKSDIGLSNVDNIKQEPLTIKGSHTIPSGSSWATGDYGEYTHRIAVAVSGMKDTDTAVVGYTRETKPHAIDVEADHVESYNGGFYIFAKDNPSSSALTFTYRILRG